MSSAERDGGASAPAAVVQVPPRSTDERKLSQHLVGDSKVSCEKVF